MAVTEYEHEPIRGLPGELPEGEHIVWQGAPDWRVFARSALYTRWIAGYFLVMVLFALVNGSLFGVVGTLVAGMACLGLLSLYAVAVSRTTVYTITNRRVVLRIGVALNTCINIPHKLIGAADMREQGSGFGDIALTITGPHRPGYAVLWPHARPFRFGAPEPMLRALPDAFSTAELLARACSGVVPNERGAQSAPANGAAAGLTGATA